MAQQETTSDEKRGAATDDGGTPAFLSSWHILESFMGKGRVGKKAQTAAIILAGGSGKRFGNEGGKQLVQIVESPMLSWSVAAFDATEDVGFIVIVCPAERREEYRAKAVDPYPFVTPIVFADSGATRQESAFSGLEAVPEDFEYVALHDGARPLVSPDLISHTINTLKGTLDADGAIVATPAVDTIKVVENGTIVGTPDRRVFWNAQTPQVFRAGIYRRAQASALANGFLGTDDSSLIERLGGKVLVVEGMRNNIKLTMPEDYVMLSAVIQEGGKAALAAVSARLEDMAKESDEQKGQL